MQGCIVSGDKLENIASPSAPDTSIITGSIRTALPMSDDPIVQSDQLVIRDEIKSLGNDKTFPPQVKWDNNLTGSEGTISAIVEKEKKGQLCRRFKTTRSAFDGVGLYSGEICQVAPEIWTMITFSLEP